MLRAEPRLDGLTEATARDRLREIGPNEVTPPRRPHFVVRVARQLRDPMTMLLLAAAVASIVLVGEVTEGLAILAILVVNGTVQGVQESRADRAVGALRDLTAPTARVRRDGVERVVPAREVVPGDVVVVSAGDRVPADVEIAETYGAKADESMLTGESLAVTKRAGAARPDEPLGDRDTELFAGTLLVRGAAAGVVRATGDLTAAGAIGSALVASPPTPLEREMRTVAGRLALVAVAVGALLVPVAMLRSDGEQAFVDAVLAGSALAVAAIPEGLVAVVTTALALGAQRMAAGGAIVRRLAALEAIGAATVLCVDKTGTLTTGSLDVVDAVVRPGADDPLWLAAARCSLDAADPVDAAVRSAAPGADLGAALANEPFDAATRYAATWTATADGVHVSVKGAPEVVLARCADDAFARDLDGAVARLASAGRRVLVVADGSEAQWRDGELRALGALAFADPLRVSTRDAVAACRTAGLRLVVVTGDHADTAAAITRDAGMDTATVVSGTDIAASGDPGALLRGADVVARVDPLVKLAVVRAHRATGAVVGMTGDGVNDAPALRQADIGIAVAGTGGTDVAREAADLVVTDGDLGTIVRAIGEGRRIYGNLATAVRYLVAGNLSEILVVAFGLVLIPELPVPLLPIHLLWINLVTDGLPALGLAVDEPPGDPLAGPQHREPLLGRAALRAIVARAVLLAGLVLGAAALARSWGWSPVLVRTQIVATLVPCHLLLAYVTRGGFSRNRLLAAAIAGSVALQAILFATPATRNVFRVGALPPRGWVMAAVASAILTGLPLLRARRLHE